jgi:hypothetical protein
VAAGVLAVHCLRIGQVIDRPCYSRSHGCLAGGLPCKGSAIPFLLDSFLHLLL